MVIQLVIREEDGVVLSMGRGVAPLPGTRIETWEDADPRLEELQAPGGGTRTLKRDGSIEVIPRDVPSAEEVAAARAAARKAELLAFLSENRAEVLEALGLSESSSKPEVTGSREGA